MSTEKNISAPYTHQSVLLKESIDALNICAGGTFVDATLGGGGHSYAMFEHTADIHVYGIDRDRQALRAAKNRLADHLNRCTFLHGGFADQLNIISEKVNGVLMDLGVSSPQLDQAQRGFSFSHDGPLDMRMNPDEGISAAQLIDTSTEQELANIIFQYGEEPRSRRIAKAIVRQRPFTGTLQLAECVRIASGYKKSRTHPATRSFQALRIAVNQELDQIQKALPIAFSLLKPLGRLAVISFHSLEDRLVKQFFQNVKGRNTPKDAYGHPIKPPQAKAINFKGFAGKKYDPNNPRARSARLRVIEKRPCPAEQS